MGEEGDKEEKQVRDSGEEKRGDEFLMDPFNGAS